MPNELDTQFWRACDILRRDDNTQSLLDYVEQISWLLFLKSFEDMEDTRLDEAEYKGETFQRVIDGYYRWSVWTGGRVRRAREAQREAEGALRSAQKTLVSVQTNGLFNQSQYSAAQQTVKDAEAALQRASQQVDIEIDNQRLALAPLLEGAPEDRQMAEGILAGLSGKQMIRFLSNYLFPYLRELQGTPEREVIRQIFEENPS
jgi:type I restriction-modification system DNA methylase subunit